MSDEKFLPGPKFIPADGETPVVGWVSVSAEIKRDYAAQAVRAVVISNEDRATLSKIYDIVKLAQVGAEPLTSDDERMIKLLDRLIGY